MAGPADPEPLLSAPVRVRGAGPWLACEELAGAEPALLCLHGNSSHRGIWRPVARALPGRRRLLLDLRGHGDSDRVVPAGYDPEHHAADIAAVVAGLGLRAYAVLAHSAGALAAARFLAGCGATGPAALVWIDIDPLVPRWQVEYFRQRAATVGRVFAAMDDVVEGFRRLCPGAPEADLRAFVHEGLERVDGGWRMKLDPATYATWEPGDLRPVLPRIACPTLVLRGAESLATSPDTVATLLRGLPRAEAREIPGGGHLLLLEQPERVAAAIRDFLARALA